MCMFASMYVLSFAVHGEDSHSTSQRCVRICLHVCMYLAVITCIHANARIQARLRRDRRVAKP